VLLSILFLLAALETGQPHCYLKHSAGNENDRISIVARDGAQVVVRFTDGSIAYVDDDNLICGVWR
jgi:predicted RNA methylase